MSALFEFQLLRPFWLLGLLPVAWLIWKIWRLKQTQGAWYQVIEPQFRPLLLGHAHPNRSTLNQRLSVLALGVLWVLAIIALAGPSTHSVAMPAEKNQQGTVIVLDLSLSMLADDLSPNRLNRAKYRLTDLITQHPELSVGMVGYAGSAHAISPISQDNKTLLGLLPALNPLIMPRYGSNPLLGFEKAQQLFDGAHINHQKHIIWITDDLEIEQQAELMQWISAHDITLSIMMVGTTTGGAVQIPNYGLLKDDSGRVVIPKLPIDRFKKLTTLTGVTLSQLTLQQDNLETLLPAKTVNQTSKLPQASADEKTQTIIPLDSGVFLLLLLVPMVALGYRRGWLLNLSVLAILPFGIVTGLTPSPSYAAESHLPNVLEAFKSPDQQAYQAWQKHNFKSAEALFENKQWRASSLYRLGNYAEAAKLFAMDSSAKGHYNRGNALAKSGAFELAKKAYETALKRQPEFPAASHNLQIVSQLLQSQTANKQSAKTPEATKSSKPSKSKEQRSASSKHASEPHSNTASIPSNSASAQTSESKETDEKTAKKSPNKPNESNQERGQRPAAESAKQSNTAEESLSKTANSDAKQAKSLGQPGLADSSLSQQKIPANTTDETRPLTEQKRATQNWLNQIPDQPGVFLKRKFEYQYQQQSTQAPSTNSNSKQW